MAGMLLRVRLTPRGGRNRVDRYDADGVVHARVSAPPVEGAANQALIELLSDALGVRKSALTIRTGATSREKMVEIAGIDPEALAQRLAPYRAAKE